MVSRITDLSAGVQPGIQRYPVEINNAIFHLQDLRICPSELSLIFLSKGEKDNDVCCLGDEGSTIFAVPQQHDLK